MEQQNAAKKDRIAKREKLRDWKKEERAKVCVFNIYTYILIYICH